MLGASAQASCSNVRERTFRAGVSVSSTSGHFMRRERMIQNMCKLTKEAERLGVGARGERCRHAEAVIQLREPVLVSSEAAQRRMRAARTFLRLYFGLGASSSRLASPLFSTRRGEQCTWL